MKKRIIHYVIMLGIFLSGMVLFGSCNDASAINVTLRAMPTSFDYTLDPGEKVSGTFKLRNEGENELDYDLEAKPYYYESDDDGNSKVKYNIENDYTRISRWITFDKASGTIEPGETIDVSFSIDVPTDVAGGGQYAALLASTSGKKSDGDEKEGVNIGEKVSIGPVVYATINGETRKTADITKNSIDGFLFNPPITAKSTVKNTGNIHAKVSYILRVYPFFGGESIYNNEDEPDVLTLLPDATRYYETSWTAEQGAPSIGIYKVQSEVRIFDEVSKIEQIVIICPMWVLILIAVFILAVIFWLVARAKARKAEKK